MECCIRLKVKVHRLELSVLNGEWDNSCRSVKFMIDSQQQGSLSFYGSQRGDEGADTDLMFQFCLPYVNSGSDVLLTVVFKIRRSGILLVFSKVTH